MKNDSIERWKAAQAAEKEYDHFNRSGAKELSLLKNRFDIPGDYFARKKVLEIGAGNGPVYAIRDAEMQVGIDPLSSANDSLIKVNKSNNNHVTTGIGEHLPFQSSRFDVVICNNVLDHVKSPLATLKEIERVLTEDGRLYLYVHTFLIPRFFRQYLTYIDRPHPHHFGDSELLLLVEKSGFKCDDFWTNRQPPFSGNRFKRKIATGLFRLSHTGIVATPER